MNLAAIATAEDIPQDVLDQINSGQVEDFGYVDTSVPGFSDGFGLFEGIFGVVFVIVALIIVAGFVFVGFIFVRNYKASKSAGLDPFTLQTQLAARVANSEMLAPKKSLEEKLAELDSLLARGLITRDEYTQARLKALSD